MKRILLTLAVIYSSSSFSFDKVKNINHLANRYADCHNLYKEEFYTNRVTSVFKKGLTFLAEDYVSHMMGNKTELEKKQLKENFIKEKLKENDYLSIHYTSTIEHFPFEDKNEFQKNSIKNQIFSDISRQCNELYNYVLGINTNYTGWNY